MITLASAVTWILAGSFDLAERWINWAALGEHFQLDEILFVLLVSCIGLMWFGKRRFAEIQKVLDQKMQIQHSLEKKHQEASELLQQNRALIKHITLLRESERNQLAGELHDVFGQYLAAIDVNASVGLQKTAKESPLFKTLTTIQESADYLRNVTRSKLRSIKPPGLDKVGLTASIEDLISQWLSSFPNLQLKHALDLDDESIDYDTSLTLYRCLQEGLVNISRHANATYIDLTMNMDQQGGTPTVCMRLSDNGQGFEANNLIGKGMGLIGIRERVNALGGEFALKSEPNNGTEIMIVIPLNAPL
ncbi:signal transduction histidine kinase, glucose-6-phosphate specific [Methylophaga frappieri]|uniref:Oxygen sensor histidine kinase NreB n=1 Tax=Methylophaga frappieri (strain ATCC BAA-2434 / DSM 25690 / JAM7) TaxID=754477 RepID=I1YK20_METFJ|nr:signal transduction histidine kinase, glucose-6-phosphate specific [Methylophaga frappieri]